MKLRVSGFAFVVCAVVAAMPSANAQSVRDRLEKDVVVATVDGQQILSSELIDAFRSLPPKVQQRGLRTVYQDLLEQLVENRLLTIHGRLNNLAQDPEVKALVKRAEDAIIAKVYMERLINQTLTEKAMRERYNELVKKTPPREEVRARHILVDSKEKAVGIIAKIKNGGDFVELAKAESKDPAASQGGDLGYFQRSDMVKPFADKAFSMKPGQVTDQPVKTEFGWHVIKVEDRRNSTPPPFERVRDQIARDLGQRIAVDVLNQARAAANIQRYTLDGQPLPPPGQASAGSRKPAKK